MVINVNYFFTCKLTGCARGLCGQYSDRKSSELKFNLVQLADGYIACDKWYAYRDLHLWNNQSLIIRIFKDNKHASYSSSLEPVVAYVRSPIQRRAVSQRHFLFLLLLLLHPSMHSAVWLSCKLSLSAYKRSILV